MTDNTILIKNALILNPNNFEDNEKSILIKDNIISEISDKIDESDADKIIDATGKIVLRIYQYSYSLINGVIQGFG